MALDQLRAAAAIRGHLRATPRAIADFRDAHVRRLVDHAYRNVPYYRRLYDQHGVRPSAIRGAADLPLLPPISKTHFRAAPEIDRVAAGLDPEQLISAASTGSSGRPSMVRRSWLEQNVLHLVRMRARHAYGMRRTDRAFHILLPKHVHRLDNKLIGRTLDALRLRGDVRRVSIHVDPMQIAAQVREYRPAMLSGYPNMLARVSALLETDRGSLGIRVAVTGAEALTPDLRQRIEGRLGVPVRDQYGSSECNLMAWECQEGGPLHVCDDSVALEVVDEAHHPVATGQRGEVFVTALHTFTMPLIRFRLGDVAEQGDARCGCGSPYSTIRGVQGRMLDMFPLPDGRVIHPYLMSEALIMNDPGWIEGFQLTQERTDRIVLQIIPHETPSQSRLDALRAAATALFGAGVNFELSIVASIPSDPSGKFRFARSLVTSSYDARTVTAEQR